MNSPGKVPEFRVLLAKVKLGPYHLSEPERRVGARWEFPARFHRTVPPDSFLGRQSLSVESVLLLGRKRGVKSLHRIGAALQLF